MQDSPWCLIDTETTGLHSPIFVVEIAAQRMRGWEPNGLPFRRLVNHGLDIPPEAARVHGYTREILERDGDDPAEVYRDFARYAQDLPIAAYNLSYDWDEVLLPEWQRLGLAPVGKRGLCCLELARRLLDPVPAGNYKLQTLRQYYRLASGGAHTALGDVETVVDLLQRVLRQLCEARGLIQYTDVEAFSRTSWYPSRIPFGKYKGRLFWDAREDLAFRDWLMWLRKSANPRSQAMGTWYLQQLEQAEQTEAEPRATVVVPGEAALLVYANPDAARLRMLVEQARNRLADLEAEYTALRQAVSVTQAQLFHHLHEQYRERDLLQMRLDMRRRYLDKLIMEGEEEAAPIERERAHAEEKINGEYERTAREAEGKRALSNSESLELKQLWRRLVKLFHPDRLGDDPQRQLTYTQLTAEINRARDAGDIDVLREISENPEGFIALRGWGTLQSREVDDIAGLQQLHQDLQAQILDLIATLDEFRATAEYEFYALVQDSPERFDLILTDYRVALSEEIDKLRAELDVVEAELKGLGVAN